MTRILLVEDNEMNRDMLTRRLERKGFTIESAGDGEEALTVNANPPSYYTAAQNKMLPA